MKNKKSAIILSVIMAIQFILPLSIWGIEKYKNNQLDEKGQEIKLLIDRVYFDERGVIFRIDALEDIISKKGMEHIVFENSQKDFSEFKEISSFPASDLYISKNRLYSLYSEDWGFKYEIEAAESEYDYGYVELFDREVEQANIKHGFCDEPETQAYAVFKIYKNRFTVVGVYINEMPVEEVIEKYNNHEWNTSRYEVYTVKENGVHIYYDSGEYYKEYYDYEKEEYVTAPATA